MLREKPIMKFPLQAIYGWYRNAIRHPQLRWWIILGTLVYLLSPLDISPDIFPIVGEIDDAILVTILVGELSSVLMDRFKSVSASSETSAQPNSTTGAETTVDVKAVVME
jgi:uncharacterized membrane protein YkvA (DUF1232 family)